MQQPETVHHVRNLPVVPSDTQSISHISSEGLGVIAQRKQVLLNEVGHPGKFDQDRTNLDKTIDYLHSLIEYGQAKNIPELNEGLDFLKDAPGFRISLRQEAVKKVQGNFHYGENDRRNLCKISYVLRLNGAKSEGELSRALRRELPGDFLNPNTIRYLHRAVKRYQKDDGELALLQFDNNPQFSLAILDQYLFDESERDAVHTMLTKPVGYMEKWTPTGFEVLRDFTRQTVHEVVPEVGAQPLQPQPGALKRPWNSKDLTDSYGVPQQMWRPPATDSHVLASKLGTPWRMPVPMSHAVTTVSPHQDQGGETASNSDGINNLLKHFKDDPFPYFQWNGASPLDPFEPLQPLVAGFPGSHTGLPTTQQHGDLRLADSPFSEFLASLDEASSSDTSGHGL